MKILLILGTLFCANSHPVSLIILLILSTLTASFIMTMIFKSSWFSLIFILVMLGGLLILFIYIASLASNEAFKMNKIMYLTPFLLLMPIKTTPPMSSFEDSQLFLLYSYSSSLNNCIAIMYLLMTLLVVIDIISCYNAPLRSNM
uniref:NADH dehydrogenase subunit 6 n=1 Tax=Poecilochirus mrciaki TaxID=3127720 RepID=UPI0030E386EB